MDAEFDGGDHALRAACRPSSGLYRGPRAGRQRLTVNPARERSSIFVYGNSKTEPESRGLH
jgi:hypothetical protein